ncbi:MAG: FecR domain-containing protein [Methylophilus sp.]|uniref:FecR domain-containing protein n=1 Tax=Methylophilus sp. TaxID=29541 RepID=UPI003FA0754F
MPTPPFSEDVAKAASEWLTRSMDEKFAASDAERLQQWLSENPEHARAWQHIHRISASWHRLHGKTAYQTLSTLHKPSRRTALKALLGFGVVAGGGLLASDTDAWRLQMADYTTGTGEMKEMTLADGTQIALNTRTAVDVHFTDQARMLHLHIGEMMVTTGHRPSEQRPLHVYTAHGSIYPMGTRFNVYHTAHKTAVSVLEGAVRIVTKQGHTRVVHAGEHTSFSTDQIQMTSQVPAQVSAWQKGLLFANNMRLADLAQELARYRTGFIDCDAAASELRISGVFTIADTSQALAALPNSLPVKLVYYTRYWVRIMAAN